MSELLDRIQREIRERLEASRAAVREHERLEAVLHALGDAGSRATRVVRGSDRGTGAPGRPSRPAAKPSSAQVRSPKPATAKRGASAGAGGGASAKARQSAGAAAGGRSGRARGGAGRAASPALARERAPRGANRDAVLGVISERPGVSARELAAASGVTGGTLYSLLRTLTQQGALEKRELPRGQTGYVVAASAAVGAQAAPQHDPAGSTGDSGSAQTETPATDEQKGDPADVDETSGQESAS